MTTIPTFSRAARRSAAAPTPATSDHDKLWLPLAVVAAVLLLVAGWVVLVSPVRGDTSAVDAQTDTATSQVDTLRAQISALEAQRAELPHYRAELAAAQAALPTTAAMPAFLRTLQQLGSATGTTVSGLNVTAPTAWTGASGSGAPVAPAGVGAVYSMTVNLTVTGNAGGYVSFVKALQEVQPRAVLVDNVTIAGTGDDPAMTMSMTAFVAPTAGATTNGG